MIRDMPKCLFYCRLELQQYGNRLKDPEAVQNLEFGLTYMRNPAGGNINLLQSHGVSGY